MEEPKFQAPDPNEPVKAKIKNLLETLGVSQEEIDALRETWYKEALRRVYLYRLIVARGGNIHKIDRRATAKRRAANRRARKQRRVNRVRSTH